MDSTSTIHAGVAAIVEEVAGVPADLVQLDQDFAKDLDVDSLAMVEVVVATEERFGVRIPDEDVEELHTVADLVDYVAART